MTAPLGWFGIVRLGLVQAAIGSIVVLATSLINRIMVVEYALPAMLPAGLVAWHYAVQLSRPRWGFGSDIGRRRTPWIIGGMAVLAAGAMLAVQATTMMAGARAAGIVTAVIAYALIGAGVGAAGTSLLALLATRTAPARRPAAAAITWIMMIAGIVVTAAVAGKLIDPFSPARLVKVASGVAIVAFLVALAAVVGVERGREAPPAASGEKPVFREAVAEIWADPVARRFTVFIALSMLAYSMQDMILEPFAGLLFGMTPGQSTQLTSVQHMGVLIGMVLVGVAGSAFGGLGGRRMRVWIVGGCAASAVALCGLALAAHVAPAWPLRANIFLLGFGNGMFAVAAIGSMMELAGARDSARAGTRMGLWGAAQAIAFGAGDFIGAAGVDLVRAVSGSTPGAFLTVFAAEAALFLVAAIVAQAPARDQAEPIGDMAGAYT